ncbi:mediator of DNA damage checkpoint protein 1 isoform X2 [Bombina bombina]|uniref:mediator of DNA damage checkpoint protein 1 isoform X2 n=1 Tax=Bombina bombina TaxID=8345 RepID=UPI00235AB188|nr:mediator of DNA damage checkpoint protein 1 isoform X2 [Bombina bombina]
MEETQRLQSDEEEEILPLDRERPVGTLRMFSGTYGPAQDFPIYWGQNTIGREAKCDVTLPAQSVSKKHAVLEVQPGCHILYDLGSLNKTRKCKVALTPHVRYALTDGELLLFADVACQYKIEAVPENKKGQVTEEETDDDSFLVPGTQNTLAVERTPAAVIRRMGIGRVLARDSGEEDEGEEEVQKKSLNKGEGGFSRGGLKISPTDTHFSRLSATFVPDSDEENDTLTYEHQFPSINLRCDSDTDTHETPTRLGSDLVPSQDYVTSPTFISKKTQLTRDTSVSCEAGSKKSESTDIKEKIICERTDVENMQEDKPSKKNIDSTSLNSSTIVGNQAKDAEKKQEKGEIDLDSDNDMDSDTETVQSDVTKKKTDVVTDRDTDVKKDIATSVQKDVEIASVDHDSNRDVEEAEASKMNRKKPHLDAFNLDSDTDIEDEEAPLNFDVEKRELKMSLDNNTNKEDLTRFLTAVKTKETSLVFTDSNKALDQADGNNSKANMEKILSVGLESGTDVLQSNMKKRQTDKVILDSDTDGQEDIAKNVEIGLDSDVEDQAKVSETDENKDIPDIQLDSDTDVQSDIKKRQMDKIMLDSDTDGQEDIAKNVEIGLDSDVEDQAKVSETDENKDIPDIQLDSDTDVEDDNTKSSMSKKTEIPLDSDTDAEDDVEVSETGEKNVPGIELDSDTDVEEDNTKSLMSNKTETVVDSDTDAENDAEVSETGEKKNVPGIELDSDTDLEESIMRTPVKTTDNKEASGINLDSDTDVEEETKASAINIDPNTEVEEGADNNLKTEPTVYHLDSETDVEDDPEVLNTDLQKGRHADSGNILQGDDKATTADMEENGTTTVHVDSDKDVEEDSIQKPATSKLDEEKMESTEILLSKENIRRTSKVAENIDVAIDSDTDVEEDTLAIETNVMKKGVSTNAPGTEEADSSCKDSISDHETPKQEATEIFAGEVEETQITDSEELDMVATQCYLDPQEKETETPDDNCAEDATQAYIFSSTWNDPDPFKRPADPIGVLQISAVTMNTSEEEVDDDAIAETQPFCFETTQTAVESVKPVVQTDKETEQEATERSLVVETLAGPVSQDSAQAVVLSEALQDDTEPISQHLATNVPVEKSAWQPFKRDGPFSVWAKSASYERQSAVEKRESAVEEEATQQYSSTSPATDLDATQDYCLNMGKGGNAIEGDNEEDATPLGNVVSSMEGCDIQSQDQKVPAAERVIAETCSLPATEGDAMQLSLSVTVKECKQHSEQATDGDATQPSVSSVEIDATQLFTLDMPAMEENDKELHMSPTEKNAIQPCILSAPASMSDVEQPCSQNVSTNVEVENEEQTKEMSAKSVSPLKEQDQEVPGRIEKTEEERVLKGVNRRGKRTKGMGEEENKLMEEQNISSVSEKKRSKMAVEAIPSTSGVIKENTKEKVTRKSGARKTARTADSEQSGASPAPEEMSVSSAREEQKLMPSNKKTEIGTVEIALEMNESNNKGGDKGDVCSTFKDSEEHLDGSVCKDVTEIKECEEILGSSTKEQKHSNIKSRIGRAPKREAENNEQEEGEDDQQSTTNRTNDAQISRRSLRGHQEEKQDKKMPFRRSGLRGSGKEEAAISSKTEGEPLKKKSVTRKSQLVTETPEEDIVGLSEPMTQNEDVPGVPLTGTRSRREISKGTNKKVEEDEGTQKNERVESTEKQTLKRRKNTREEKKEQEDHKKLEVPVTKSIARRGRSNLKDEEKGIIEQNTKSVEMLEEEPVRKSGRTQKHLHDQQGRKEEGSINIADGYSEKQEGDSVKKSEIEDPGKTIKRTRSNSREGMEADREKTVKTQISQRTRKNSREGVENKEQDEKETKKQEVEEVENSEELKDPIRKSRRTRTNSREDKGEMENPGIIPSSRRTRRNSKEEKQKATQENDGTEKMETVDPIKNVSKRVRKNSKNEDNTEQEKNESVAKKQIGKTTNRLKDHDTAQVEEELEKTQSKDDTNVSKSKRLRSKKPSENEKKESSESEELSLTVEQPRAGRSTQQAVKEASTPVPPRKRGRCSKDEEEEVKKKKTSGDTNQEADKEKTPIVGRRNQRNRLVANEPETDGINTQMSLSPAPSPTSSVRSRSRATSNSPSETTTPRRTNRSVSATSLYSKNVSTPKVLFTGVVDSAAEVIIRSLGGDVAESVSDCTHLVTDRVIRTVKFLCALARGIPIITLDWIYKCKKSSCFLSHNGFLVKDKVQEKNFNFNLSESLQKAKKKPLFEGYEIHVTPNVKPEPEQMKEIIQCSGATYLPKMPRSFKEKCVIVSCAEDLAKCKVAPATVPVTTAEFILSGILRQEADPSAYLLSAAEKEAAPIPAKRRR